MNYSRALLVRVAYSFCIIDPAANDPNNRATLILPRITGCRERVNPVRLTLNNEINIVA
jgi:hypothetical protein